MSRKLTIQDTPIAGLKIVSTQRHLDARGQFTRLFCQAELGEVLQGRQISQINQSVTMQVGAVRGMHFQHPPHAEMKLVRCLRGKVWDVAVDLRADSPTFGQWHAAELSAANGHMMVIPEGFAHGFQVLEAESELLYLHTAPWTPAAEGGIAHDDPRIGITWPLPVVDVSARDSQFTRMDDATKAIRLTV